LSAFALTSTHHDRKTKPAREGTPAQVNSQKESALNIPNLAVEQQADKQELLPMIAAAHERDRLARLALAGSPAEAWENPDFAAVLAQEEFRRKWRRR
jgi:hypothetical protein